MLHAGQSSLAIALSFLFKKNLSTHLYFISESLTNVFSLHLSFFGVKECDWPRVTHWLYAKGGTITHGLLGSRLMP